MVLPTAVRAKLLLKRLSFAFGGISAAFDVVDIPPAFSMFHVGMRHF